MSGFGRWFGRGSEYSHRVTQLELETSRRTFLCELLFGHALAQEFMESVFVLGLCMVSFSREFTGQNITCLEIDKNRVSKAQPVAYTTNVARWFAS